MPEGEASIQVADSDAAMQAILTCIESEQLRHLKQERTLDEEIKLLQQHILTWTNVLESYPGDDALHGSTDLTDIANLACADMMELGMQHMLLPRDPEGCFYSKEDLEKQLEKCQEKREAIARRKKQKC